MYAPLTCLLLLLCLRTALGAVLTTISPSNTGLPTPTHTSSPTGSPTPSASRTTSPTGSPTPSVSRTTSPTGSPTPSASRTTSPTGSPTPSASSTISPTGSPTPSASSTTSPTGSPTLSNTTATPTNSPNTVPPPSPSPSPSSSPSAYPLPKLTDVSNMSVDFDSSGPTFNMSASLPLGNNVSTLANESSIVSTFSTVTIGNMTVLASTLSNVVTVSNSSNGAGSTYVYTAPLDSSTQLAQAYNFYNSDSSVSFAGLSFDIPANSVKWSVNLTSASSSSATTLRYLLTGLLTPSSGGAKQLMPASDQLVTHRVDTPAANMTTYYVPLFTKSASSTTVMATVVLFDVAVVDGTVTTIQHNVVAVNSTAATSYEVVLTFPPFTSSLYYDPNLGMGVLLGSNDRSGGGGGDNTGLIVGVAVAVPVAVVVVLTVVIGGVIFVWWKKWKEGASASAINFDTDDTHDVNDL